ncbi:MAG: hypothetical protein ACON4M_04430 [Crocinitomicaceae bacterium]
MKKLNCKILFFLLIVNCMMSYSQNSLDTNTFSINYGGEEQKKYEDSPTYLSVGGYYRFLGCFTSMNYQYDEIVGGNRNLFVGDDSNLPQLSLNLELSPSKNTSFSTDLYLWTPLTGKEDDYVKGLLLGVNLNGKHKTNFGEFNVKTGGIHWYRLSNLTFASNTGYNRYSLFERNPWDPNTKNIFDRYQTFYENGALTQDERWGQQAFQGFIFEGLSLPKGFDFSFMYGKSQLNGGTTLVPNNLTGGKIKKRINDNFLALNYIRSSTFSDSLSSSLVGFNLLTSDFEYHFEDRVSFTGEFGAGNYFSPNHQGDWGEAIDLSLKFNKEFTFIPIEIRYFRISPNVINNNGIFWNTSIQEYTPNVIENSNSAPLLFPFASSLTNIGQMTNNRYGLILNSDIEIKRNKLSFGYSCAGEIEGISNIITYNHPANNIQLSRFWRWDFPTNVGPYGNLNKIYRGVYEKIRITDSITAKGFNSIELNFKSFTKLFNKDLMIFYLGGFHSVQNKFNALPNFQSSAYLRSYNQQLEFYLKMNKSIVLSNYFAFDRIYGGENTELDIVSNKPKNQIGLSYAIGVDISLSKNTGLYIRHRWMDYEDLNYTLDKYKGQETSVELKIYF